MHDQDKTNWETVHQELRACADEFCRLVRLLDSASTRSPTYHSKAVFFFVAEDCIESGNAIKLLCTEGMLSACRRELRFLIETCVKLVHLFADHEDLTIEARIKRHKELLDSTNLRFSDLDLYFLPDGERADFRSSLGRLYGKTSKFVHLTEHSVSERVLAIQSGQTIGFESAATALTLAELGSQVLSSCAVLLFHAVDHATVGDLLVGSGDSSAPFRLGASKYFASVDRYFDYKAERQPYLAKITAERDSRIRF